MAKKNPTKNSLRQGQAVFYVHSLGENSFIRKYTVASRAYKKSIDYFVDYGKGNPMQWFSLKDCNVIPNSYNSHRLFYKRGKAEKYLKYCLTRRQI
tara:strand:+ start:191 stop:478 length:288 start_codon:yes stop_codon:yes gene_type:complete